MRGVTVVDKRLPRPGEVAERHILLLPWNLLSLVTAPPHCVARPLKHEQCSAGASPREETVLGEFMVRWGLARTTSPQVQT